MNKLARRSLLTGAGLLGLGTLAYGGSLGACAIRSRPETALLLEPLFVARHDIHDPVALGEVWLREETAEAAVKALLARPGIVEAALVPDVEGRRHRIGAVIAEEFTNADIVTAGRWVVARSEARLASAWMAYG